MLGPGLGIVVGLAAEGQVAAGLGGQVAIGGGTAAGAIRAAQRLVDAGATALLSFGLAGGLDPALLAGAVVVPLIVIDEGGRRWRTDPALNGMLLGGEGALWASSVIVATAAGKRAVWQRWAVSVTDMESGGVAEVALAAGIPFAVLRAVCDPAGTELPPAAMTALDAGGRISVGRLAGSLSRHPRQIQALLRLGRQAGRARAALLGRVEAIGRTGVVGATGGG